MTTKVLVVEDDPIFAEQLKNGLEGDGFSVEVAPTASAALPRAQSGEFDVVLTDNKLPGPSGLDLIGQVHATHPGLPMILMTGLHDTDTVIKSARLGAMDYFSKPEESEYVVDPATGRWLWLTPLAVLVDKAAGCKRLMQAVTLPGETTTVDLRKTDRLIGRSVSMQNVYKEIGRVAASSVTVLVRGETGTGKELVARALFSHSTRPPPATFIVVNCAAIPEHLLESELFGHEAGSFTGATGRRIGRFEQADGGTIFLDEIGDMNSSLQRKLLRVLQEKTIDRVGGNVTIPIDVRVIAATHRDLEAAIQTNEFREDLYYRLNVATVQLPALRDRPEDIPDLVDYFIQRYGSELGSDKSTIAKTERPAIMEYLQQQSWPGNIRELRSAIRKALLLSHGYPLTLATVRAALEQMTPSASQGQTFAARVAHILASARNGECENVEAILTEEVDRELYGQAFRRAMGDQSKAAQWLGVARSTMRGKLTRLGILPSRSAAP